MACLMCKTRNYVNEFGCVMLVLWVRSCVYVYVFTVYACIFLSHNGAFPSNVRNLYQTNEHEIRNSKWTSMKNLMRKSERARERQMKSHE